MINLVLSQINTGQALIIGMGILFTLSFVFAFIVFIIKIASSKDKDSDSSSARSQARHTTAAELTGERGETTVASMLARLSNTYGGYVINDVILPTTGKNTTQIDHIYISKLGIYVIETKNYAGRIYGDEDSTYWTQVLGYGDTKAKLYNPLKQNETHVKAVKRVIGRNVDVTPLVIFVQGNIQYIKSSRVYTLDSAKKEVTQSFEKFSTYQIEDYYEKLSYYVLNPIATKEEHSQNVKSRHGNKPAVSKGNNRNRRRRRRRGLFGW